MIALLLALAGLLRSPCDPPDAPMPTAQQAAAVRDEIRGVVAELGGSPRFADYLVAVAGRESKMRPGIVHTGDAAFAAAAYRRLRAQHVAQGHPFALRPEFWLSYGLFGQNSNYHGHLRDPRQLCTVRGAVSSYQRSAKSVIRRMRRRCVARPTWADLHRAVQGGDLCPDGGRERIPARLAERPLEPGDIG